MSSSKKKKNKMGARPQRHIGRRAPAKVVAPVSLHDVLNDVEIETLSLYYFDCLGIIQIAERYGISKQSVFERIARARKKLRKAGLPEPIRLEPSQTDHTETVSYDPDVMSKLFGCEDEEIDLD